MGAVGGSSSPCWSSPSSVCSLCARWSAGPGTVTEADSGSILPSAGAVGGGWQGDGHVAVPVGLQGDQPPGVAVLVLALPPGNFPTGHGAEVLAIISIIPYMAFLLIIVVINLRGARRTILRVNALWLVTLVATLTAMFGYLLIGRRDDGEGTVGTPDVVLGSLVGGGIGGLLTVAGQLAQEVATTSRDLNSRTGRDEGDE